MPTYSETKVLPIGPVSNPDGKQLGGSATDLVGYFGATPVAQQGTAGNTATVAAGSVTNVFVNTTFSGGVGTTAYTVGDIVKALKAYGLLA